MVFDVIAVGLLVAVFWRCWTQRGFGLDPSRMPLEDRPPLEARYPVPRFGMRRYVVDGLEDLEYYLSGRDQNA